MIYPIHSEVDGPRKTLNRLLDTTVREFANYVLFI